MKTSGTLIRKPCQYYGKKVKFIVEKFETSIAERKRFPPKIDKKLKILQHRALGMLGDEESNINVLSFTSGSTVLTLEKDEVNVFLKIHLFNSLSTSVATT